MGLRVRVRVLRDDDVRAPARAAGAACMTAPAGSWLPWAIAGIVLVALPFVYQEPYPLHIMVIILIWAFVYTSWSVMGRFGLVSLGHGGFFGIGAYVTALLWNYFHLTPWLRLP